MPVGPAPIMMTSYWMFGSGRGCHPGATAPGNMALCMDRVFGSVAGCDGRRKTAREVNGLIMASFLPHGRDVGKKRMGGTPVRGSWNANRLQLPALGVSDNVSPQALPVLQHRAHPGLRVSAGPLLP